MKRRKNKSFNFLKFGIILFGICLLLWRCDKEDTLIETTQIEQKTLIKNIENVSLNTINNSVKNTIIGIKTKNKGENKGEKNIIYNFNNIVKTIDTLGNTKYSIIFQVKNQPKNVLYNLITGIEKDKTPIVPYVMKYTISNLKTNKTYDFGDFNGIIEKYAYNDFFKKINNQKYHHKGDNETPLKPCLKSGVFGGGGGNNGNANGSFSDNLSNTNTGTSNISGFRSPFYSFSSGTGVSGLTPTSCISGLTTGPLSDPEVDGDDDGGSSSGGGGGSSNDVVPPGCIDEATTTKHITKLIEDCYDTNSPINPECIGKLLDENGNCIDEENTVFAPSCESFNFQKITSNWQESSVINIRFNIVLIEIISGIKVKKVINISFLQPVKFGMPTKFANGTVIPSGLAAEIGAKAINHAIDDVISKYNNLVANSTSTIRNHFKERLKQNFQDYSNGGRVNFNDTSLSTNVTSYKTYGIIPDNCF